MFSVTITSNAAGWRTSAMAAASTSRCSSSMPGNSAATSVTTLRQSRLEARTLPALSTLVTFLRRYSANWKATRATRAISPSVYQSVSTAARPSGVCRSSEGFPK